VTRLLLDCTASVVGQEPVLFVEPVPVNLVTEELCSEPASQQLLASAAAAVVEIAAAAAAEMLASSFVSAAVVSDVAAAMGYSSYWCLT